MGSVVMKTKYLEKYPADCYREVERTEYIYCDECGSFSIKDFTPPATWLKISIGLLIAGLAGAVLYVIYEVWPYAEWLGLPSCIILAFIAFVLFIVWSVKASGSGHKCRKCRNTEISVHGNALDYPNEDMTVLDVSEWEAHVHINRYID